MPDIGIGALGYVGYGVEVTEGTAVAPTKFLAVNSANFSDSNDYLTPLNIRQSRDIVVAMPAPFQVTGTTEMLFPVDDIAQLLKSAFAATVVTTAYAGAAGAYTHVMTPGDTSPTFSFETSAQGQLIMRYSGVRVNTMEVKAAFGEIVTGTFGLDGTIRAKQGGAATPAYAATSATPLHFNAATVTIAAAANIGDRSSPKNGYKTPAATGTPSEL